MGLFAAIANGLKAVAAIFGYAQQRDAEKNAPAMQANAAAQTGAAIDAKIAAADAAAAKGDLAAAEKLAAE